MNTLSKILEEFESSGLVELDDLKLLDRTDTKFTFSYAHLPGILNKLVKDYKVLNIEGLNILSYKTVYYDTKKLSLYLDHHNQRGTRFKIRHRTYVESGAAFIEVKIKNNKGRTIKKRLKQELVNGLLSDEAKKFIREKAGIDPDLLEPSIRVSFERITLLGKTEKVTFDLNLEFSKGELRRTLPDLVIAEIKQSKKETSPVLGIFKEERIKQSSISKYCLGVVSIYPQIKQNNFRQKMRLLTESYSKQ